MKANLNNHLESLLADFFEKLKLIKTCNKKDVLKACMYDDMEFSLEELELNMREDIGTMEKIYRDVYLHSKSNAKPINIQEIGFDVTEEKIRRNCFFVSFNMNFKYNREDYGNFIMGSSAVKIGTDSYLYDPILDHISALEEAQYFLDEHNKNLEMN